MNNLSRLIAALCSFLLLVILPGESRGADQPRIDHERLVSRIHELVNRERSSHGLPPLAWNGALAEIASAHSEDMRERRYLSHVTPEGETPTDRGNEAGFRCRKKYDGFYEEGLAENLCRNSLFHATKYTYENGQETRGHLWNTLEEIAASTVHSWMEHAEHRANILNPRHGSEGIGLAVAADGKVYITQLFC